MQPYRKDETQNSYFTKELNIFNFYFVRNTNIPIPVYFLTAEKINTKQIDMCSHLE